MPKERPLKQIPQIFIVVLLFFYTLFFVYRAGAALLFNYPLEFGEGMVMHEAGQLLRHSFDPASLYLPNTAPPYQSGIYSPLYYYLEALLMGLTGPRSFLAGRLISVVAALYIGWLLYRVTRRQQLVPGHATSVGLSLATALTPFAITAIYAWSVINKADLLGIAFSLAAVERIWAASQSPKPLIDTRPYVVAGLLCTLALMTKQSNLAAPAAIVIWLLLERRWVGLRTFGLGFGGSLVASVLFFQVATGGAFFQHVVTYNAQPYYPELLIINLTYLIRDHFLLLGLAALWLLKPLFKRGESFGLWRWYCVVALGVSLTAGKAGTAFNVYIESLLLINLLAWWQIGQLALTQNRLKLGPLRPKLVMFAYIAMVVQLLLWHHIPVVADATNTPGPNDFRQGEQIMTRLRELSREGPVWSLDCAWLVLLDLPVDLDDPFTLDIAARNRTWDSQLFTQRLNTGYYRTIVYDFIPAFASEPALQQAFEEEVAVETIRARSATLLDPLLDRSKYQTTERIGRWFFLRWKG